MTLALLQSSGVRLPCKVRAARNAMSSKIKVSIPPPGRFSSLGWFIFVVFAFQALAAETPPPVTVPLLHIGPDYFTNATLTLQSPTHVTVLHSRGMTMAKAADLDPDIQQQLGLGPAKASNAKAASETNANRTFLGSLAKSAREFRAGAAQAIADNESKGPPLQRALAQVGQQHQTGHIKPADRFEQASPTERWIVFGLIAFDLIFYYFFSRACSQLCSRAGWPSAVLVWLPGLKRLALYRATSVSWWWVFWGCLLFPPANFIAWIICCMRLCDAFERTKWWVWLMILPFIGWPVFIYFARTSSAEENEPAMRRMKQGYAF